MIHVAGTVSKSWMADTLGVAFDREYYFDPARRHAIDSQCNTYLSEHLGDLNLLFTESNLGRRQHYDPRQVLVGGIQPNMLIGMLVGADFVPHDRMDADISPTPLAGVEPADLPPPETLLAHPLVRLFDDQFRRLQRDAHGDLVPIPPLFWDGSGRAAIHGPLTTAQKLFGESIFLDLMSDPKRITSLLQWVTDVSIVLTDHFARLADREITQLHVGECSACMINAETFEQFLVPSLSRLGRELGPVRLHSCGKSDHLLAAFEKVRNLGSLDVGGETSVATIRGLLGPDFPIDIAPLVNDLVAPDPDGLLAWTEQVARLNQGGPLTIVYHLEKGYGLDNLRAMQDHLA